ncbi:MAG: aldo/keto reductase [Proteobacteria bacterium]|jgi:D-threo-aldose 1-dehydrogenase|nr:aldo/keto reductase [Pseudomonadota bacterium]MDA1299022.1 aldo/keto reductase [Pseudomonadota bacterium]
MALKINTLGSSGVKVTELGFGGAPIGSVGPRVTEEQVTEILNAAWDIGIRYFDTAPLYGHGLSERRVGRFLSQRPRDEFALSSKVGRLLVPEDEGERFDKMLDQEPFSIRYDYSYDGARRSLEASFERLGLDRVDILLCHDIDIWTHGEDKQPEILKTAREGILRALSDLKREGVIRAFGLGVNEWQVCNQILDEFDVDCFLLAGRFTLLEQAPLDVFLPRCVERNVSIIIGGPFNSGLLANAERRRATYDYKPVDDARWDKAQSIRRICENHDVDMRAAALRYPLMHPAVAAVIPGMWHVDEVHTNLELLQQSLPDALWSDLSDAGLVRLDGIDLPGT